jgi:hypothetical protein
LRLKAKVYKTLPEAEAKGEVQRKLGASIPR